MFFWNNFYIIHEKPLQIEMNISRQKIYFDEKNSDDFESFFLKLDNIIVFVNKFN